MTGLAIALSFLAGLAGSVQVAVMGRFGDRVGSFEALAFSALVTALVATSALLVVRRSFDGYAAALRAPVWLWIGGVLGAFIVFTITIAGSRLGTAATVSLLIAGNLGMAAVIDRFGLFGLDKIPLRWERVLGIGLLVAGAALSLRR